MDIKEYKGKPFMVAVERSRMERRFQLRILGDNQQTTPISDPLAFNEFIHVFGFSPVWPHSDEVLKFSEDCNGK